MKMRSLLMVLVGLSAVGSTRADSPTPGNYTWNGSTNTEWQTTSNWSTDSLPNTFPGIRATSNPSAGNAQDIAIFTSTSSTSNIGINMSDAGGSFTVGTIQVTGGVARTIGNSSITTNGTLTLFGNTIGTTNFVLLDVAGANLTIANQNSGTGTQTMALRLGSGGAFTDNVFIVNTNRTLTVSSNIINSTSGASQLTLQGGGTINLSAANTYTGNTFVQANTRLFVNNTSGSGTGTGTVTVSSGATFGGTGSISGNSVTLQSGATIQSGNGTNVGQTLNIANGTVVFNNNATLRSTVGTSTLSNTSTTGASLLNVNTFSRATTSSLINVVLVNDGTLTVTSNTYTRRLATFNNLSNLSTGTYNSSSGVFNVTGSNFGINSWEIIVNANSIDIVFTPVPEPGVVLAASAAGLLGLRLLRRRRVTQQV